MSPARLDQPEPAHPPAEPRRPTGATTSTPGHTGAVTSAALVALLVVGAVTLTETSSPPVTVVEIALAVAVLLTGWMVTASAVLRDGPGTLSTACPTAAPAPTTRPPTGTAKPLAFPSTLPRRTAT